MEEIAALDPLLVADFVGKCHGGLGPVKELLTATPALVNACHDWGGGDWESGLGAAAHMGRRNVAEYLLGGGARIDLFAAAMLGKTKIVRAVLADQPSPKDSLGPHDIPLMAHAKKGGENAVEVVKLLEG